MDKVLYVAEVGSLHKGNLALACEFIRQYAAAGADIVKFQFGWNSTIEHDLGIAPNPIRYITHWASDLKAVSDHYGVELMASIFSEDGLRAARGIGMKRYKFAHQMLHHEALIDEAIADGKTTYISMSDIKYGFSSPKSFYAIYTQEQYPVLPIRGRQGLQLPYSGFTKFYGFSDHSLGIGASLLAVAMGARYIEKHVCLDKTDLATRDTTFALLPNEFKQLVESGREIERAKDINRGELIVTNG